MSRKSETIDENKKYIASRLMKVEALKFGEFKLTSGKTAPYYLDLRIVPSYPELLDSLTDECSDIITDKIGRKYMLAGVPTAGLPFASIISYKLKMPLVYVREKKKSHGREKAVEGKITHEKAILIDDLTTTGGSILSAAETLRGAGIEVKDAVVMVEREEGAVENLEEKGIDLHYYLKISNIIEYLRESSEISQEEYNLVREYLGRKN